MVMIASPSAEYRSEDDRLAVWRRAALERQRRFAEIASVPAPGYHERNLAAERGALVTVDSFLGSLNTDRDDDAYAPPGQVSAGGFAFRLERSPHPVLEELRERFGLEEISGHGSDLERAIRVRSWIKSLWAHGQPWRFPPYDGLLILDRASRGVESFICMHYSVALVHACLSLGIQARLINLHRGIADESAHAIGLEASVEPPIDEHVTAEIWSRELEKWVMVDPDFDCSYERNGAPQSAWDLHDALVTRTKSEISVLKGPGAAAYDVLGPDFYVDTMLDYYAHVSILMRNNFLSDPDGPIPALHLTDTATPRILWHRGEDMRLRPDLLGPMVVATPFSQRTPVLTDGNLLTGWASEDTDEEHWVEIRLPAAALLSRVVLHWPEWLRSYRTSVTYRIEALSGDGSWSAIADVTDNHERAWTVHDVEPPLSVDTVRVVQPRGGGFPGHTNRLWLTQIELL